MPHICVSESGHHWLRYWFVAYSAPSHSLNQCWDIVICTLTNKNQNTKPIIYENASENIVCEMAVILFRGIWVVFQCIDLKRGTIFHKPSSQWEDEPASYKETRGFPTSFGHCLVTWQPSQRCGCWWPDANLVPSHPSPTWRWPIGVCHEYPTTGNKLLMERWGLNREHKAQR